MSKPKNTYTHGHHSSVLRSHERRNIANSAAYLESFLNSEITLLDIGAGPGSITIDFARRVQRVTATEQDANTLRLSRDAAERANITNIDFEVADIHQLPFADNSFDIVHAHQVLQHVADPVIALKEMARVAKAGGLVAARDADYAGFFWTPQLPELDQWLELYRKAARANNAEPDAGRHFRKWANAAGLSEAEITVGSWCYSTPEEREWWGGMWEDRILHSDLNKQLLTSKLANSKQLEAISAAWRRWAEDPAALITVPNGELLWRKPRA